MSRTLQNRIRLVALVCILLLSASQARTADLVQVQLHDGRTVFGTLTSHSNDENWIEISSNAAGVELHSRFPRSNVVAITKLQAAEPQEKGDGLPPALKQNLPGPNMLEQLEQRRFFPPPVVRAKSKVQSIQVVGNAANWDRDVADDGLLVFVTLLDEQFFPVERGGSIRFELYGERFEANLDQKRFLSLGHWGMTVKPTDFRNGQLMLKLPWRKIDPSRTGEYIPEGLLTARFNVSGEGSFDASDPNVPLQPATVLRDDLQLRRGIRFFPGENWPER